mmetsp:Transcript_35709/g.83595  ORF Transcript_35709/g.83595 Transcript_35709/m.83595 type:complete len:112 (+) Transcript_35709:132-467(+)
MGKMKQATHDLMLRGGFQYDAKKDRYFMKGEAEWDVAKRIDKGRKQYAVPASSVEDFLKDEEKMVDALLKKLQDKATAEGKTVSKDEDAGEEAPAKKRKKEAAPAEEEEEE